MSDTPRPTNRAQRMKRHSVPSLQAIVCNGSLSAAAAIYELRQRGAKVPVTGSAFH